MVTGIREKRRGGTAAALLSVTALLMFIASPASAQSRFIAATRVSGDDGDATVSLQFNCKVGYLQHAPASQGDRVRIQLEPTSICNGISPLAAQSRMRLRPANADAAHLVDIEYDGAGPSGPVLILSFSQAVSFSIADTSGVDFNFAIHVGPGAQVAAAAVDEKIVQHQLVEHDTAPVRPFILNLASYRRIPTVADAPGIEVPDGRRLFFTEAVIDGVTWYRLRLGDFASGDAARAALGQIGRQFPDAWIDQRETDSVDVDLIGAGAVASAPALPADADEVDRLMDEARREMVSDNLPRAIQIYTKVLQMPAHPRHPEAQEYLALAREKQGQLAHAKAEYQRYLSLYPNAEGAARVNQRLAAMLAPTRSGVTGAASDDKGNRRRTAGDWRVQTFVSQYYRRDVNQPDDRDQIISQSALYSDANVDARRRGERFDISARLSAGYRNDFLDEDRGSGNEARISYAYVDMNDARTGLQGRLGRQSRNTGGVLGRFDGLNVGYQATERILVNAVVGKPAYSANDGVDSARTFYGTGVTYGPVLEGLELGLYFIDQTIDGIDDRQAVGGEFRYFGDNQSVWGLVDYDTHYNELGSAFLQASWRFANKLSLHGSIDRRHSPFLSTGNALIGQPVEDFETLADIFSADELYQLGLDRSPLSTTVSVGFAHSLTPRLQINADYNRTEIDETPDSGGVFGTPAASYRYFSTSLVASSLFREGDVLIVGARYSDSDTARVATLTLDGRIPFGRKFRLNPRLRVDRRERLGQNDYEWIYTPGLRMRFRWSRKVRFDLEAGKQFSQRETELADIDRESYFINLGYQAFF